MRYIHLKSIVPLIAAAFIATSAVEACSRLLWNSNEKLILSGRTFDWYHSLGSLIYVNPRGMKMDGDIDDRPYAWTSKYGSVTSSIATYLMQQGDFTWADGATDGINEKGLAAHALYLQGSIFVKDEESLPAVSTLRWVRYVLDNFATVEEAVEGMRQVHIIPGVLDGNPMNFHLAMEDRLGDSAIIEFIDGVKTVKRGKQYTVLTNNPPYTEQVVNLKAYSTFGGAEPIPGNVSSEDRFVRLSYYSKFLPATTSTPVAQSHLLSVMRTVATPVGAPYPTGSTYPTWWVSVADLTNLEYYFTAIESPNLINVDLKAINFDTESGMRWLNPRNIKLSGMVNSAFQPLSTLKTKTHATQRNRGGTLDATN